MLVEQYRKALEKAIIEIPAGKLEPGEKPEVTAVRELEEETGYVCENMELITSFYTSPGFIDEILYVYKATGLTRKENKAELDEDEFVELMEVSLEEAITLMKIFVFMMRRRCLHSTIFTTTKINTRQRRVFLIDFCIYTCIT